MNTFIKLSFIALSLFVAVSAHGQRAESKKHKEKIEAEMIGFLTQKLELTPDQAQSFFPLYREHKEQERTLRKTMRGKKRSESKSETDYEALLASITKAKEDIYQLDKFYQVRYNDILSAKQSNQTE